MADNNARRTYRTQTRGYRVEGNTVRSAAVEPVMVPVRSRQISEQARSNRERSLQMNLGYVIFLAVAAVLSVAICVNYLKLQANYTQLQKTGTSLEVQLSELRLENDAVYNRIISSVNLEHVKDVAMNKLGMVYSSEVQTVTYQETEPDYVRQYQDIPG